MAVLPPEKKNQIVIEYKANKTPNRELARNFGVTNNTIRNIIMRAGVYVKPISTESKDRPRRINSHQTFLDRIKVSESGCWEWQRTKDVKGYGKITINGVFWQTHRYAYQHYKGPIGDLYVCHKCDNPCCCNPDHLFLGNASDNALDMIEKGRGGRAKLTRDQIFKIRELSKAGLKRQEISEQLGVTRRNVDNVVYGKRWAHLTEATAEQYQTFNQNTQS